MDALDHHAEEGFVREGLPALFGRHWTGLEFVLKHLSCRRASI
jgi:hypothetical protein